MKLTKKLLRLMIKLLTNSLHNKYISVRDLKLCIFYTIYDYIQNMLVKLNFNHLKLLLIHKLSTDKKKSLNDIKLNLSDDLIKELMIKTADKIIEEYLRRK